MSHQMRTWGTFFNATVDGVAAVMEGEGNFALLYDYPILEYWKGAHGCNVISAWNPLSFRTNL